MFKICPHAVPFNECKLCLTPDSHANVTTEASNKSNINLASSYPAADVNTATVSKDDQDIKVVKSTSASAATASAATCSVTSVSSAASATASASANAASASVAVPLKSPHSFAANHTETFTYYGPGYCNLFDIKVRVRRKDTTEEEVRLGDFGCLLIISIFGV